ncbi:MAG TPA: glycine cleavage T C-terminal barrel domain-containing protein, partial [Dermatophilaceae bacterium]|nr:glycine cleavage T C-terminal barrel domain-containing protein [Dermatophilaceae bacterium]
HRNGVDTAYLRSASYGHTLGGAVGLAMISTGGEPLTQEWLDAGEWEVDVAGRRHPVTCSLRPRYDPRSLRVRG